jgi:hypothetical protein
MRVSVKRAGGGQAFEILKNYGYTLVKSDNSTEQLTTDPDGLFTLKHGESALFDHIQHGDQYYVEELSLGGYEVGFLVTAESGGIIKEDGVYDGVNKIYRSPTLVYDFNDGETVSITVVNKADEDVAKITVTKAFEGTAGSKVPEGFKAVFVLTRTVAKSADGKVISIEVSVDWTAFTDEDGDGVYSYTFSVPPGIYTVTEIITEPGTGLDIYKYTNIRIVGVDGTYQDGDATAPDGLTSSAMNVVAKSVFTAAFINYYNDGGGYLLPEAGGIGVNGFIAAGSVILCCTSLLGLLLLSKLRRRSANKKISKYRRKSLSAASQRGARASPA